MTEIEKIHTNVDPFFLKHCIDLLKSTESWKIAANEGLNLEQGYTDTGMLLKSYSLHEELNPNPSFTALNTLATYLFKLSLKSTNKNFLASSLTRIFWNFYNPCSYGTFHSDSFEANSYSMVYNLSNSGGTEFESETILSKPGLSIIFPSNLKHRGMPPESGKIRFALNVVFQSKQCNINNGQYE